MASTDVRQDYELIDVNLLDPHPQNPNQGDVESIRESLRANQWYGTVTVRVSPDDEDRFQILAGEHRWRAAKAEQAAYVPCVIQRHCDDLRAARIMIADNATARRGVINNDRLGELVSQLGSIDGTGLDAELGELADFEDARSSEEREAERAEEEADAVEDEREFVREYGLVLTFETEGEQEQAYNSLRKLGYERIRVASI